MDKNTLKGLLLMGAVIFLFMYLSKPKPAQNQQANATQAEAQSGPATLVIDSLKPTEPIVTYAADYIRAAGVKSDNTESPVYTYTDENVVLTLADGQVAGNVKVDSLEMAYADVVASNFPETMTLDQKSRAAATLRQALVNADKYKSFSRHRAAAASTDTVTLRNDVLALEFSPKGGYISKATLLDERYKTYFPSKENPEEIDSAQVVMFNPEAQAYYDFIIRTTEQQIRTSELTFVPEMLNDSTLLMKLDLGGDTMWGLRYTLAPGDSYLVKMEVVQRGIASVIPPSTVNMGFDWHLDMPREERGRTFEERNSGIYYKYVGDKPDNLNGMRSDSETLNQTVKWLGFKNQFFSTVIIPRKNFEGATIAQTVLKNNPDYLKEMNASATFAYDVNAEVAADFDIFIGPNLYPLLKKLEKQISPDEDLDLTRLIPLGWSWLRWINTLIVIPVFTFLSGFISSYGVIILLLTIFIKIILFPFTYKSYMSQAKMRVLAPEIKEINDKYPGKENAMVRQQKTMALYSRAGASPFSGCLPLLLQMPILIAMFSFFPSCIELRGQSFLWAHDLAAPDVVLTLPFSIPFYGNHVSLFCLLMTVTNIIYTRINMQNQPSSSSMPGMKWMMYLMPLMFLFFFNDYAAALSYYYFLSLLITIIQTYIFRRCVNEKKLRQRMMENAAKPKKKSGFMARLEEAQRKQQAMLREQQKNRRR